MQNNTCKKDWEKKKDISNRFANNRDMNQRAHETTQAFDINQDNPRTTYGVRSTAPGLGEQYLPLLHAVRTSQHLLGRLTLPLAILIPLLPELQNLQLNALLKPLLKLRAISEEEQNLHPDKQRCKQ